MWGFVAFERSSGVNDHGGSALRSGSGPLCSQPNTFFLNPLLDRQGGRQAVIPGLSIRNQFAKVCTVFQVNIQDQAGDTVAHCIGRALGKNDKEIVYLR